MGFNQIITLVFIVGFIGLVVIPFIFFRVRKIFREQKNYERGLKMVPLLIHLPPLSEDIEEGGRDSRDVVEENISRARVMYDVLASTRQRGFKSGFYGQRHVSFEIVCDEGSVDFYVAVPIVLVEVVKQAVTTAYSAARVEEVPDHNIFNKTGKTEGTVGGELTLKEDFAYPIATYQELKRDAIQSILNALSTLEKEDGASIQIMLRPAQAGWRKHAHNVATSKRKGSKGLSIGSLMRDLVQATYKAPEEKDSGNKELSNLEQSVVDAIDDKTRYPGFETSIRLIASSSTKQRAQAILSNLQASFSLFEAQGKNGFKYTPAKDVDKFITGYILRMFPQESNSNILNAIELATIFHFPDQSNIPTTQLERQSSKQVDGPRNMPDDGLLLGYNIFRGEKKAIRVGLQDRRRHMYAVGQTGTGKSTFLENLALQDMLNGDGFAFVDPHGDTAEKLLSMVPKERTEDVIYFCPADMEYPMGLNLFEFNSEEQKDFLIQETINMLEKLYDPHNQGIIGPRYHHLFRNAALTVMADPAGGTFVDIPKLFRDPTYVKEKLKHVKDQNVLDFWQKEMPASQRSNDFGEVVSWFVSKFGAFLSNQMMRNIIGQTKSAFDLRDIMDNKKILLVNLSKGRTGDLNSKLLGMIFVMKFQAAAMSRANIPEDDREDFCLYVDEFQNFSTDSFSTIMSEARKYRLNLIVANQFTTQLSEEIRDAVFGNVGTIVSYRVGQNDVDTLAKYFTPIFDAPDLLRVPNYNSIVRTLVNGVPTQSFSMAALPPLGTPNPKLKDALKQLSHAKHGRPRAVVDAEITERMKVKAPSKGSKPSNLGTGAKGSSSGSSFLDDWLAKRKKQGPAIKPAPKPASSVSPPSAPVSQPSQKTPPSITPLDKKTPAFNTPPQLHQSPHKDNDSQSSKSPHTDDEGHTVVFDRSQQ